MGVYVREGSPNLFSKGRILFSIKAGLEGDLARASFVFKSLWNRKITSLSAVTTALAYHDYAYKIRRDPQ